MRLALKIWSVLGLVLFAESAAAGQVKLVSDTWDYVCRVEVISGLDAPNQGTVVAFDGVPKNWSIVQDDKICYRRSSDPADCNSALTDWRCDTELLENEVSEFSLS